MPPPVTLGGSIHAGKLRASDNCVVVDSAPHTVVMREAALVVTHGGHGTVMRALVNRVPMLVIPHGRDQNDNAVRVTERGAGLSLMRMRRPKPSAPAARGSWASRSSAPTPSGSAISSPPKPGPRRSSRLSKG